MRLQAPRGTEDLFPAAAHTWREIESRYFELARRYGYGEIRTPMFEDAALFDRTAGEFSDIVQKEMYVFRDRGDRLLALKPEGTAPVVRAVIEGGKLPSGGHLRLAYRTEIFRYGRPGRGRLRQGHQVGAELLGSSAAAADAEMIELAMETARVIGVEGAIARVNSIGRTECRRAFGEAVLRHLAPVLGDLTEEARGRVEANPLGALDSKDPTLKAGLAGAPSIRDFLEPESKARLVAIEGMLGTANVPFEADPTIVRGLDYYTETVFEVTAPSLPDLSLVGGGRYDDLVSLVGGSPTPAVGFAMGIERAMICLEAQASLVAQPKPVAFLVAATPDAAAEVRAMARELRLAGSAVELDLDARSLKSQLRQADASGARYAALVGADELAAGTVTLRDLAEGVQETLLRADAMARLVR